MFKPPPLKLHLHSQQYRAYVDGGYVYFGRDYEKAKARYLKAIATSEAATTGTIAQLIESGLAWAATEYKPCGRWRGEAKTIKYALRFLDCTLSMDGQQVYVPSLATDDFTVVHLSMIQRNLVKAGKSRTYINGQMRRIIKVFVRCRLSGLVSAKTIADLQLLPPVRRGHPTVHETGRVLSVDDATIQATLPGMSSRMRDMVMVLRYDGMRVGELCPMRLDQLNEANKTYDLGTEHKTGQRRYRKVIKISDASWAILLPHIQAAQATMNTRAFIWPSDLNPLGHIQTDSVRDAILQACVKRGIKPHWTTHQLRHSRATEIAHATLQAAREVKKALGHSSDSAATGYIDPNTLSG